MPSQGHAFKRHIEQNKEIPAVHVGPIVAKLGGDREEAAYQE